MNAKPHLLLCRESVILVECLRRKKDCLAWSYEQMTGLPTTVAVHCLNLRDQTPVKQPPRKYHPMVVDTIVREVDKLINVDLRSYSTLPGWPISFQSKKKMARERSASTTETSTRPAQRMTSLCRTWIYLLIDKGSKSFHL